jgi:hypothetical protein
MPCKGFTPEKIIAKQRLGEVAIGNGKSSSSACKDAGIFKRSYYRWR